MDAEAYASQLKQLLPRGALWKLEPGSILEKLLLGLAEELARIDARAAALVNEWDPRTALETLPEWERLLGITPAAGASAVERQIAIVATITKRGGSPPAYFEGLAASLGFSATVVETVANTWRMDVDLSASTAPWGVVTLDFRSGTARAPDRLGGATVAQLESVINRTKPAHTAVSFNYI